MAKHAYEPWEATLFKEDRNLHLWVVEYKGCGQYFDTFDEAISYLLQRHADDASFATKDSM
jgi:hypothetical protein